MWFLIFVIVFAVGVGLIVVGKMDWDREKKTGSFIIMMKAFVLQAGLQAFFLVLLP